MKAASHSAATRCGGGYDPGMSHLSVSRVLGCLTALAAAAILTSCSGGSSTPAAPATGRQAVARLVTNAELPDGIRTNGSPGSSALKGGPPFTQHNCIDLVDGPGFFAYNGSAAAIYANEELAKRPPANAVYPELQAWPGDEALIVYRGDGAQEAMSGVTEVVRKCARSAQNVDSNGINVTLRAHLTTISGIGDLTLNVEVRTQESNGRPVASDWTVTRSGNALLVVSEGPTIETQYLLPVAQAAWKAYSQ